VISIATLALAPAPQSSSPFEHPVAAILFGCALIALSVGGLRIARFVVDFVSPRIERVSTPWNLLHVALLLVCMVLGVAVVGQFFKPEPEDIIANLVFSAALLGCGTLGALAIASVFGSAGLAAFGLRANGNLRSIGAACVTYVACLPGFFGIGIVWAISLHFVGHDVHEQEILSGFARLSPGERLVPFLIGALMQPLFEEVLFRGLLQPTLVQIARPVAGIAITSILFAALHGFDAFLPILSLSVLLGWIRERTQSLAACWSVHVLHNGGQLLVLFFLPQFLHGQSGWWSAHP
jgi:membrane protease YdiL (CAAX protease family)